MNCLAKENLFQMIKNSIINNISTTEYIPGKIDQIVIGVHGFAGDKESSVLQAIGEECMKNNTLLITFDLPCHGNNDNAKILSLKDCLKAVEIIESYAQNYKAPISYFSTSFGAYLTLIHIQKSDNQYKSIILRAPAIYMDEVLVNVILPEHGYSGKNLETKAINLGYAKPLYIDKKFLQELKENRLENIYSKKLFLNIIQGKKDDVVNYKKNEKFFKEKLKDNYKIYYFENANHRYKNPGELEKIVKIFKEIIF